METVAEFKAAAKAAILAGNLDEAEKLTKQAQALKALEVIPETPAPEAAKSAPIRLPFAQVTEPTKETDAPDYAIKSFSIKRYGDLDAGFNQVSKELYGASYEQASYYKNADFRRFVRTGTYDPALKSMILLTPNQIGEALADMATVAEIKATMIEASNVLGGYTVPEDFRTDIVQRLPGMTVIRKRAKVLQTASNVLSMIKRTGGTSRYTGAARVTWTDESPSSLATSATNSTFGKIEIPVHVTLANIPLSRSLLEDTGIDIVAYISDEISVGFAIDEDEQFLVGSGNGRPQGILNGNTTGGPHNADITTLNSGAAATLTADKLVGLPMKIDAQYRNSPHCVWIGAKATYEAIYQLKDGSGRYLWRNHDDNLSQGYPKQLQGYAIEESEAMPALGANNYPLIFGDVQRGYTIADRIGMSLERYQDSNTAATDSVVFYARRRLGGQVTAGWAFGVQKCAT